ncbi:MAG: nucleotide exchange factor GrpE [Acidobacteriaceae bacterium]
MRHNENIKTAIPPNDFPSESGSPDGTDQRAAVGELEPSPSAVGVADETSQSAEIERLQAERDQLLDRLARLQADFDNHRKREARERMEYRDYALVNTVEQFLPVLDNFQLALRSQGTLEQLRSGVDLIVRQMEEILRTLGVQPVPTLETRFDPRLHEAIEMVEREDIPDHQVMEEVRRGYTLRERLLRPALVRVANNSKQKTA